MPTTDTMERQKGRTGSTTRAMPYQIDITLKGAEDKTQSLFFDDEGAQAHAADQLRTALDGTSKAVIEASDAFGTILVRGADVATIRTVDRASYQSFVERENLVFLNKAAGARRHGELSADAMGVGRRFADADQGEGLQA